MEYQNMLITARKEVVEIANEMDRDYWALRLGVSCEKVKSAVKAVQSIDFSKLEDYLTMEKCRIFTCLSGS